MSASTDGYVIYKPSTARKLLKMGFKIIDLKPQKQLDGTINFDRTTFVFENTEELKKVINEKIK